MDRNVLWGFVPCLIQANRVDFNKTPPFSLCLHSTEPHCSRPLAAGLRWSTAVCRSLVLTLSPNKSFVSLMPPDRWVPFITGALHVCFASCCSVAKPCPGDHQLQSVSCKVTCKAFLFRMVTSRLACSGGGGKLWMLHSECS